MSNPFDEVRIAVQQAEQQLRAVDLASDNMARLLRGRLRHVTPRILKDLKRELSQFDALRQEWKA